MTLPAATSIAPARRRRAAVGVTIVRGRLIERNRAMSVLTIPT
jgi:hypothetical protein